MVSISPKGMGMTTSKPKHLHWMKQVRVPAAASLAVTPMRASLPTPRERLVAALADRPRTVAQLAQTFGLSQPTMLEQVRRALRDGLVVEVQVAEEERRFSSERYYSPAVPVVREPDRELLQSACRALADDVAAAVSKNRGDVQAAFAMTHLAREGWEFGDVLPYLHEMISRLVSERVDGFQQGVPVPPHGLAWVEDIPEMDIEPMPREEETA